ncbi:class A beta-lactamase-related serine hydrolase [Caulobacter vibrioides]|uniref:serine hydrolase domain-containing protein n=1 Tax=Caulobacter vibrioides TaxID=155892 RepID=UPI000BB4C3B4|nr:serine hydrolase domain-containing protein [Caulobacter vibrioides]ATC23575.1 serine hydrolase [Caulobacter vibrioides]AZH11799.1 class A beta-lactamase-related serine hydrolase [Caulobacter vibrioides]PLR11832.1 serine hydrolase [Caulobacter vibrioides]
MMRFSGDGLQRRSFLALVSTTPLLTAWDVRAQTRPDPIDALVAKIVTEHQADGISVAVVQDNRTRHYNAGLMARDGSPVSERSVFEIGSISKTFTGLLLAHAIKERRLVASDDVRQHLPAGYDNLVRDGRPVRLIDLVNTTSALPDNIPDWRTAAANAKPSEAALVAAQMLANYSTDQLMIDLRNASLVDVPGRTPRHSNVASELLRVVLERVYGQSYQTLLARYIERPFGMGAGVVEPPRSILARGYDGTGLEAPPSIDAVSLGAGNLRYSAIDMARYLNAHLAASSPAIALTHEPTFGTPETGAIGYHWLVNKTADSQLYLSHSGSTYGFSSYCEFYPGKGYGSVILANRVGLEWRLGELARAVHEALFGPPAGLKALEAMLEESDYADVAASVSLVRQRYPELHLTEDYVNGWGYRLIEAGRPVAGRAMFAFNVASFPASANAYDSYGDGLAATGDKGAAISNYRRSLELNPGNDHAREMIAKLVQP